MVQAFGNPFNVNFFDRNNVFAFAKKDPVAELKELKIYFDVGDNDDFGFEDGAERLHKLLDRRGVPNEFHVYPGRHDPQCSAKYGGQPSTMTKRLRSLLSTEHHSSRDGHAR